MAVGAYFRFTPFLPSLEQLESNANLKTFKAPMLTSVAWSVEILGNPLLTCFKAPSLGYITTSLQVRSWLASYAPASFALVRS